MFNVQVNVFGKKVGFSIGDLVIIKPFIENGSRHVVGTIDMIDNESYRTQYWVEHSDCCFSMSEPFYENELILCSILNKIKFPTNDNPIFYNIKNNWWFRFWKKLWR